MRSCISQIAKKGLTAIFTALQITNHSIRIKIGRIFKILWERDKLTIFAILRGVDIPVQTALIKMRGSANKQSNRLIKSARSW